MPNDIELLEGYIKRLETPEIEENKLTDFKIVGAVYPWTNEPLHYYYKKSLKDKNVLSVTSSGDHILHAALAGAKQITGFDINRFCKYYSALKVAMIKTYSHDKFFGLMCQLTDCELESDDINKIIKNVKKHLKPEELSFWEKYAWHTNSFALELFQPSPKISNNAYFDSVLYNILQENLYDCSIKYVDSGIDKLDSVVDEKFDFVYLSNILDSIHSVEAAFKVLNEIRKLVNKNGEIHDYCYLPRDWHFKMKPYLSEEDKKFYLESKTPGFYIENEKLSKGRIYTYKLKGN